MNIVRFTEKFLQMEEALSLFAETVDGDSWWDIVRYDVFYRVYNTACGIDFSLAAHVPFRKRAFRFLESRSRALRLTSEMKTKSFENIVLRAPKRIAPDRSRDHILDDIVQQTPGRSLLVDTFPLYFHIRRSRRGRYTQKGRGLALLSEYLQREFHVSFDVSSMVDLMMSRYVGQSEQYKKILDDVQPKRIIIVQNGIEKALFSVARKRSVPVIEAQHGYIGFVHPAYSYPAEMKPGSLSTLPSVFLTFSDHWARSCNYPVPCVESVGNRELCIRPSSPRAQGLLVVSSDMHQAVLEPVVIDTARQCPDLTVKYKLHPNQFAQKEAIRMRFASEKNISVIADEKTLQQLFEECHHVLAIQSTGVYEALQAGRVVSLLASLDYETHADLFGLPNLRVVRDSSELVRGLTSSALQHDPSRSPKFFEDFDAARVAQLMKRFSA